MSAPWDEDEVVATKAWDHSLFRRLLRFAGPHKALFVKSFAVLLGLFALELGGTWIWRFALDGPVTAAAEAGASRRASKVAGRTARSR